MNRRDSSSGFQNPYFIFDYLIIFIELTSHDWRLMSKIDDMASVSVSELGTVVFMSLFTETRVEKFEISFIQNSNPSLAISVSFAMNVTFTIPVSFGITVTKM